MMGRMKDLYTEIMIEVSQKFNNKCAYCNENLSDDDEKSIDSVYPENEFSDQAYEKSNYVLSCLICIKRKGSLSPCDEKGNELFVNPLNDKFEDHIYLNPNGIYTALTPKGEFSIKLFALNRKELIKTRIDKALIQLSADNEYSSFEAIVHSQGPYNNFHQNKLKIEQILSDISKGNIANREYLVSVLYANVITLLESYLSETFLNLVLNNENYIQKFVETFHDYKYENLKLNDLYKKFESIESIVAKSITEVIFHNIPKVQGMYKDTLGIKFPRELEKIHQAIKNRHDIVHRNGRTTNRKLITFRSGITTDIHLLNIEIYDVKDTLIEVELFIEFIEEQVKELHVNSF